MTGYDVYKSYVAIKLHFQGKFDYFKYHGKVKTTHQQYEKRHDRSFFEVVSNKLRDEEVAPFFVANFLKNDNQWIGEMIYNFDSARQTYLDWKKKMLSLYKVYEEDLTNVKEFLDEKSLDKNELFMYNDGHPLIFRFMIQGMIEKETFILLDDMIHFIDRIRIKNDFIWKNEISHINRYRQFIQYDASKVKNITLSILIP